MNTPLLNTFERTFYTLKTKYNQIIAVCVVFALLSLGLWIFVIMGQEHTRQYEPFQPYFLGAAALLPVCAAWIYFRQRFQVTIAGTANGMYLEAADPDMGVPFLVQSPFVIYMQWHHVYVGRGRKIKMLIITLCDTNEKPLVSLAGSLGSIYSAPSEFEYLNLKDPEDRVRLKKAPVRYSASKIRDIALDITEYMESAKKAG